MDVDQILFIAKMQFFFFIYSSCFEEFYPSLMLSNGTYRHIQTRKTKLKKISSSPL
jgi:hypothetical protein